MANKQSHLSDPLYHFGTIGEIKNLKKVDDEIEYSHRSMIPVVQYVSLVGFGIVVVAYTFII